MQHVSGQEKGGRCGLSSVTRLARCWESSPVTCRGGWVAPDEQRDVVSPHMVTHPHDMLGKVVWLHMCGNCSILVLLPARDASCFFVSRVLAGCTDEAGHIYPCSTRHISSGKSSQVKSSPLVHHHHWSRPRCIFGVVLLAVLCDPVSVAFGVRVRTCSSSNLRFQSANDADVTRVPGGIPSGEGRMGRGS